MSSSDAAQGDAAGARGEDEGETVLSLEEVEVHFEQDKRGLLDIVGLGDKSQRTVRAVDGVSLDVYRNDVVALVGESGCGKTTLGKAAIGLQRPTEGSVRYRGQDIWEAKSGRSDPDISFKEIRKSLQLIHQDPGSSLNPNRKVVDSLSSVLKKWNPDMDRPDRRERIFGLLERTSISPPEDYANRYPHQLSGGEQQRVALIRALLMNPDIILADEAISALDVSLRIEMMDLMLELQDLFETSYLFISHDLSNARYIVEKAGGRIAVMYLGEIVEIGSVDDIIHNPTHPYTKALNWATPELDPAADEGDMPVRNIDIPDAVNPPSGCRFHTRCPEAREVCAQTKPELLEIEDGHRVSCFRGWDDHEYWESDLLPGVEQFE